MAKNYAPGNLERLRTFLNTWYIDNETRVPMDILDGEQIEVSGDVEEIRRFRDDLREYIEQPKTGVIEKWMENYPVVAALSGEPGELQVHYIPGKKNHVINEMLCLVVEAVQLDQWAKLKICPDCRFVFYDHSKNGSKKWCGMYAESAKGRACGTIDKVRRYRSRKKAEKTTAGDSKQ